MLALRSLLVLGLLILLPLASAHAQAPERYSSNEILDAGHRFFGSVSRGLASVVERAFSTWGQPNGYILGQEGGGAFIGGLRYGEGTLYTKNAVDFTPSVSQGTIAKIVLTVMLALAASTVFSLLWMSIRVRRSRRFGRRSAAVLRSLYALLLGLGGFPIVRAPAGSCSAHRHAPMPVPTSSR